eukprot:8789488-Pyramimonas_sp.AAC.1
MAMPTLGRWSVSGWARLASPKMRTSQGSACIAFVLKRTDTCSMPSKGGRRILLTWLEMVADI